MRAGQRRLHRQEEEEESAFVSMTDMTVSFLFIVMIMLAFFASQIRDDDTVLRSTYDADIQARDDRIAQLTKDVGAREQTIKALTAELARLRQLLETAASKARLSEAQADQIRQLQAQAAVNDQKIAELRSELQRLQQLLEKKDPLKTYLSDAARERRQILETLRGRLALDFPDLQVVISGEMDALRFKGDGLFGTGQSILRPEKRQIVERIASHLNEILPCYTLGEDSAWKPSCNSAGAVIEAVQVEGHTDSDGPANSNMALSTARANETFFAMTSKEPALLQYLNPRQQPVLSVAGYGEMRPISDNNTPEGKAMNRRIDLRIIMYTPSSVEEIAEIARRLGEAVAGDEQP